MQGGLAGARWTGRDVGKETPVSRGPLARKGATGQARGAVLLWLRARGRGAASHKRRRFLPARTSPFAPPCLCCPLQVVTLFAVQRGFLDAVPPEQVGHWLLLLVTSCLLHTPLPLCVQTPALP